MNHLSRAVRTHWHGASISLRSQRLAKTMSSASSTMHHFFVYAPDVVHESTLERRLSVRSKHLERAKSLIEKGVIKFAGALLTPDSIATTDGPKKMTGSTFVFEAEKLEDVKELVEDDVYWTSNVWDHERVIIQPFMSAKPLN